MKKLLITLFSLLIFSANCSYSAETTPDEIKKDIIAAYNSNDLDGAYKLISRVMEQDRDYELWYLLGNLSQDINNSDENAIFFYKKSLNMNPEFDKAHYNLGNIYLKQKKYNSAINEYKYAIKYKKDYAYYYYNLGCAYFEQKEYDGAKVAYKKAISLKNDEPVFYYNLALVYKKLNNSKQAQKALDKYNELNKEE